MRKWRLPLTYQPKIEPVFLGTCRQTIRKGWKKQKGDLIRFFVWSEKPYRSKQIDLTEYEPLVFVHNIKIFEKGICFLMPGYEHIIEMWCLQDFLAERDGIVPATGSSLRDVLTQYNKIPKEGLEAQILRW